MIASTARETRLRIAAINSYYGDSHILRDVSLEIGAGETVALLGRNGVGKTTTLKSIVGWVRPRTGSVTLDGRELMGCDHFSQGRQAVPAHRDSIRASAISAAMRMAAIMLR